MPNSPQVVTILYQGKPLHFVCGPYMDRIGGTVGVKLAREIDRPCDIDMPCKDFGAWTPEEYQDGLQKIIAATLAGRVCYIGCMGGIGRTGTVLAGLYRTLSVSDEDPVAWVRRNYLKTAVETEDQKRLARTFNVDYVRRTLNLDPDGVTPFEEYIASFIRWMRDPFGRTKRPQF